MKNRLLAAGILCGVALLSGCAATKSSRWTDADTVAYEKFRAERMGQARALAGEGDQALAGGNAERALERYAQALRTLALRGRLGIDGELTGAGYRLKEVADGLPAAQAGLRVGDMIVRIRGVPESELAGVAQWDIAFQRNPGEPIPMTIARKGGAPFEVVVVSRHWVWEPLNPSAAEDELVLSLRIKAARAAGQARSVLPIPAAAREHAVRAQSLARSAKTPDTFADVSREFRVAGLLAPAWADVYISHALFQEATDDAIGARESLALYLEARPNAPDRASVSQKQAALAGKAEEQRRLMAWEGFWGEIVNGRRTESGIRFERKGKLITARNNQGFEYLRGTIVGEFTAQSMQRANGESPSPLGPLVKRCFNGLIELSGTMQLSPDKRTLTVTMQDFYIDHTTCRVQRNTQTFRYGR